MTENTQDDTNEKEHDLVVKLLKENGNTIIGHGISPFGYQVPHLINLEGNDVKTNLSDEYKEKFNGTVVYSVELFYDDFDKPVIDKHGVKHYAKPVWLIDNPVTFFNTCLKASSELDTANSKLQTIKHGLEKILMLTNISDSNNNISQQKLFTINKTVESLLGVILNK